MKNQKNNTTPITSVKVYRDYIDAPEQDMKAPPSSKKDSNFPDMLQYVRTEMKMNGIQHIASTSAGDMILARFAKIIGPSANY
jgi:hypothetical protein